MRLIDADVLAKAVEKSMKENPHKDYVHKGCHVHEHNHFLCMIAEQPTAFDIEGIVEDLEETKKDISNITTLGECFKIGYRKGINEAIEIVKGGVK